MKRHLMFLWVFLACAGSATAQQNQPFVADSLTRALWHFNETSGSIVSDSSGLGNNGVAYGTTIVPGRFGNARSFNGVGDYIVVPSSTTLDLDSSDFQIDLWFKTGILQPQGAILLRRGLAPDPGYMISVSLTGKIVGMIGDREDSVWPDTLISAWSDSSYADNNWHLVTFIRDRTARKLFLYIDGVLATKPVDDVFTIPLNSYDPLTIGRWESTVYPYFFSGLVDEVRITSSKNIRKPIQAQVAPTALSFGWVRIGAPDTISLNIRNAGFRDTLRIPEIGLTNSAFSTVVTSLVIAPDNSVILPIIYSPSVTRPDTGAVVLQTNDPAAPLIRVPVSGHGFTFTDKPLITNISLVYGPDIGAQVIWFRTVADTAGAADPVTQYSLWRLVNGSNASEVINRARSVKAPQWTTIDPAWDFIVAVPATQLDQYGYVAPILYDYNCPYCWTTFMVAAQTRSMFVYQSAPDSIQYDPPIVNAIRNSATDVPQQFELHQNYPNPFNPSTTITYGLPRRSNVSLAIFNTLGQLVSTLVSGNEEAGYHAVRFDGSTLASGMYFYRIQASSFVQTKKFLLIK